MDSATVMGVCSTCAWAHFTPPGPAVRYLPPMYDKQDFDPYWTPPALRPRTYMQQERSHYRSETRHLMLDKNYTVEGQGGGARQAGRDLTRVVHRLTEAIVFARSME